MDQHFLCAFVEGLQQKWFIKLNMLLETELNNTPPLNSPALNAPIAAKAEIGTIVRWLIFYLFLICSRLHLKPSGSGSGSACFYVLLESLLHTRVHLQVHKESTGANTWALPPPFDKKEKHEPIKAFGAYLLTENNLNDLSVFANFTQQPDL